MDKVGQARKMRKIAKQFPQTDVVPTLFLASFFFFFLDFFNAILNYYIYIMQIHSQDGKSLLNSRPMSDKAD